jgi:transcriptional regulator with XRE-family HTH domain
MSRNEKTVLKAINTPHIDFGILLRESNLTPQEAADKAGLHINTVKKLLSGAKTHPNSVTKLKRALLAAKNTAAAEIAELGNHFSSEVNNDLELAGAFSQIVALLEDRVASAKENQAEFLETDIDALWVELDRVEGLLQIFVRAQERLRRR